VQPSLADQLERLSADAHRDAAATMRDARDAGAVYAEEGPARVRARIETGSLRLTETRDLLARSYGPAASGIEELAAQMTIVAGFLRGRAGGG
jgi:hypothetical protein